MQKKYRSCAGAVVFNKKGQVLLGSRVESNNDAWQFPQGGIERNETPAQAAKRELFEEMNISSVDLVYVDKEPICYEFPDEIKDKFKKNGIYFDGQEIYFALFFFKGSIDEISVKTKIPEFKKFKWENMNFAVSHIIDFKKHVYIKLAEKITPIIEQYIKNTLDI